MRAENTVFNEGQVAYDLLKIYTCTNRPACSFLKLRPDDADFREVAVNLAEAINWDSEFLLWMLKDLHEGNTTLYQHLPTMCREIALRLFDRFLISYQDAEFQTIMSVLCADALPAGMREADISRLVKSRQNYLLQFQTERLRQERLLTISV